MRLMGVDFGFKRIGIAMAESSPQIITARPPIMASGTLKVDGLTLAEMANAEEVDLLVLGLPIEESGEEGKMARICRTLGSHIAEQGVRVEFVDERFTSLEADRNLRDVYPLASSSGITAGQRRKLKDGEAARLILERFLNEREKD